MLTRERITDMLDRLLATEHEMVEACRGAIERLANADNRDRVFELLSSHRARADAINQLLHAINRDADGPSISRVHMGDTASGEEGDEGVLRTLQRQSSKSESAYEAALHAAPSLPNNVSQAVKSGLQDARRWRRWLSRVANQS